jgi:hypothetical protein
MNRSTFLPRSLAALSALALLGSMMAAQAQALPPAPPPPGAAPVAGPMATPGPARHL